MREFAEWLSQTPPSAAIQSAFWFIRLLQATHLLAAGLVVSAGVLTALRMLGWYRGDIPFDDVWKRFAPWLIWGLAVMLTTGVAQVLGDPVREFTSTSYWVKMALLVGTVAGTLAIGRAGTRLPPSSGPSLTMKAMAVSLILCWLAIPLLGRMIAYDRGIWGSWSLRR